VKLKPRALQRAAAPTPFAYFASQTFGRSTPTRHRGSDWRCSSCATPPGDLPTLYAPFVNGQNILNCPPSLEHWFGTDSFSAAIRCRAYCTARAFRDHRHRVDAAMVIRTAIGLLAGWHGSRLVTVTMQAMDVLLAFPSLILGLILVAMLGPSMLNIIIAIALTSIPPFARIARAPTIAVKEREFIDAGRALGYSDTRILVVHILPNILPEILVMGSLWLANAIRTEASLAFVGLGVKPPIATWGGMIREGFENILDSYWLALVPGLAILIVIFALNLLGDGLRDAIDPKLKGET
jgi:peptide/nickel transport system permease protein